MLAQEAGPRGVILLSPPVALRKGLPWWKGCLARMASRGVKSAKVLLERPESNVHRVTFAQIDADGQARLETAKADVMHIIVHSDKGHDSFLLEPNLYTPHIAWVLGK